MVERLMHDSAADPCQHLTKPADVEQARRRGLAYVYLGYWIAQSAKMAYKSQFSPIEGLSRGEWKRLA